MDTKMTLSASVVLYGMLYRILTDENGNEKQMPFGVKYKLHRCKSMLEKDVMTYETHRVELVQKYGTPQEDGNVKVSPENEKEFTEKAKELLSTEVTHEFAKLQPAEVSQINLPDASDDEMTLFIACMVDDPKLEEDLKTPIQINNGEVAETPNKDTEDKATNK